LVHSSVASEVPVIEVKQDGKVFDILKLVAAKQLHRIVSTRP
jgi:hypothetical protein